MICSMSQSYQVAEQHWTEFYSRAVRVPYVLTMVLPHTNLQLWTSYLSVLYLTFLRCKMKVTIVPTSEDSLKELMNCVQHIVKYLIVIKTHKVSFYFHHYIFYVCLRQIAISIHILSAEITHLFCATYPPFDYHKHLK